MEALRDAYKLKNYAAAQLALSSLPIEFQRIFSTNKFILVDAEDASLFISSLRTFPFIFRFEHERNMLKFEQFLPMSTRLIYFLLQFCINLSKGSNDLRIDIVRNSTQFLNAQQQITIDHLYFLKNKGVTKSELKESLKQVEYIETKRIDIQLNDIYFDRNDIFPLTTAELFVSSQKNLLDRSEIIQFLLRKGIRRKDIKELLKKNELAVPNPFPTLLMRDDFILNGKEFLKSNEAQSLSKLNQVRFLRSKGLGEKEILKAYEGIGKFPPPNELNLSYQTVDDKSEHQALRKDEIEKAKEFLLNKNVRT